MPSWIFGYILVIISITDWNLGRINMYHFKINVKSSSTEKILKNHLFQPLHFRSREQRSKDIKRLVLSHKVSRWQNHTWTPGLLISVYALFTTSNKRDHKWSLSLILRKLTRLSCWFFPREVNNMSKFRKLINELKKGSRKMYLVSVWVEALRREHPGTLVASSK